MTGDRPDASIAQVIEAEADRCAVYLQGALERADLVSVGWLATITAPSMMHPAALRLRIRWAMRDALRQEWRAQGRVPQSIRWPVYWPRTDDGTCHDPLVSRGRGRGRGQVRVRAPYRIRRCADCPAEAPRGGKRCEPCAARWRREYKRTYNHMYNAAQREVA